MKPSRKFCAVLLALFFFSFAFFVVLILASDIYFEKAVRLEKNFRWDEAEVLYARSVSLSPLDARYPVALADFLLRRRLYVQERRPILESSRALYERAAGLNPFSSEIAMSLGRLELYLVRLDKDAGVDRFKAAWGKLDHALGLDPNGANTCYLYAYNGVSSWGYLADNERSVVLDRARYALTYRPWYALYLYRHMWRTLKDISVLRAVTPKTLKGQRRLLDFIEESDLWLYWSAEKKIVGTYRKKEEAAVFQEEERRMRHAIAQFKDVAASAGERISGVVLPQAWKGISDQGEHVYQDGHLYWAGTVRALASVPGGAARVVIKAKGADAEGVFPFMVVRLDEQQIGECVVSGREWADYVFDVNVSTGIKVLSITYLNDKTSKDKKEDRNLHIGEARVIKP